jgi:hypothetical protein
MPSNLAASRHLLVRQLVQHLNPRPLPDLELPHGQALVGGVDELAQAEPKDGGVHLRSGCSGSRSLNYCLGCDELT